MDLVTSRKLMDSRADAVLGKVEMERKLSMVKAWEEHEKSKVDNRCLLLNFAQEN